jgi:hypothetical protein
VNYVFLKNYLKNRLGFIRKPDAETIFLAPLLKRDNFVKSYEIINIGSRKRSLDKLFGFIKDHFRAPAPWEMIV